MKGITEACCKYKVALIGGETAEMSGVYKHNNNIELVGCVTGLLTNDTIINSKQNIKKGNILLGLQSSGPHTNGYTLIRKIVESCDESDIQLYIDSILAPIDVIWMILIK